MNIAIILSGGIGSRMGINIPKQYVIVDGQPIINYCLKTFIDDENIDAIVIGVANEWMNFIKENLAKIAPAKPIFYAQAGETRQYSIYNALKTTRNAGYKDDDYVIIHDAARPLVSHKLINRCLEAVKSADAILPVIPVKDTMYMSKDGKHINSLLNRNFIWSGQAPEAFPLGKYLELHDKTPREELLKINGSTELSFKAGHNCCMVDGDPINFKITTIEDLSNFEAILNERKKEKNESIRTSCGE